MTSGFIARHLAIATLCFCPPLNSLGKKSALAAIPTCFKRILPCFSASCGVIPSNFIGPSIRLSSTLKWSKRLKLWKTIPTLRLTAAMSQEGSVISTPLIMIFPPVETSSLLRHLKNVLFPVPEGPMMLITSPSFIVALTSLRT